MSKLKLGVVMPVVNCLKYSQQTYKSFSTKVQHHWFIIDNGSTDGTREWAESLSPNVTYIRNEENIGVAKSWNLGMAKAFEAGFDPVLVINNDLVFDTDTVDNLLEWYGEEGQNKFEFVTVTNVGSDPSLLNTYERKKTALVAPNFIGFLINSRTVKRIGWFDEGYEMAYFEDNDYHARLVSECIAAAQVLDAPVVHYGSRAIKEGGVDNSETYLKNRVRFKENHGFFPGVGTYRAGQRVCSQFKTKTFVGWRRRSSDRIRQGYPFRSGLASIYVGCECYRSQPSRRSTRLRLSYLPGYRYGAGQSLGGRSSTPDYLQSTASRCFDFKRPLDHPILPKQATKIGIEAVYLGVHSGGR
jgi:GT2 family glycosyltransferase